MNEGPYNLPGDTPGNIVRTITGSYSANKNATFTVPHYGTFTRIASQSFKVDRVRDLASYAMIAMYNSTSESGGFDVPNDDGGYRRDLNFIYNSIAQIPTGVFALSEGTSQMVLTWYKTHTADEMAWHWQRMA